jgi:hypothetical protein
MHESTPATVERQRQRIVDIGRENRWLAKVCGFGLFGFSDGVHKSGCESQVEKRLGIADWVAVAVAKLGGCGGFVWGVLRGVYVGFLDFGFLGVCLLGRGYRKTGSGLIRRVGVFEI